jgi:hemoglobin
MQHDSAHCHGDNVKMFTQVEEGDAAMSAKRFGGGEGIRMVDAMVDMIYPPVPFPSNRIAKAIGEEGIRMMVRHHHDLLRKTKVGDLFPRDPEAFEEAVRKSADFFVEMLGGAQHFTPVHGEPRLRMRHFKIPIDENDREIWLAMFKKTLKEIAFPPEHLRELWEWVEPLSIRMINRRTTMQTVRRHYWEEVSAAFEAGASAPAEASRT